MLPTASSVSVDDFSVSHGVVNVAMLQCDLTHLSDVARLAKGLYLSLRENCVITKLAVPGDEVEALDVCIAVNKVSLYKLKEIAVYTAHKAEAQILSFSKWGMTREAFRRSMCGWLHHTMNLLEDDALAHDLASKVEFVIFQACHHSDVMKCAQELYFSLHHHIVVEEDVKEGSMKLSNASTETKKQKLMKIAERTAQKAEPEIGLVSNKQITPKTFQESITRCFRSTIDHLDDEVLAHELATKMQCIIATAQDLSHITKHAQGLYLALHYHIIGKEETTEESIKPHMANTETKKHELKKIAEYTAHKAKSVISRFSKQDITTDNMRKSMARWLLYTIDGLQDASLAHEVASKVDHVVATAYH